MTKSSTPASAPAEAPGLSNRAYQGSLWAFGLITVAFGGFLAWAEFFAPEEPTQGMLFAGRFHPATVHLPIGLLTGVFLLEFLGAIGRSKTLRHAGGVLLFFAAASAALAVGLGLCLEHDGGYNEDLLEWHERLGLGLAWGAVAACFVRTLAWRKNSGGWGALYWLILLACMGVMGLAGHKGGGLTHGTNFLTEHMPDGMQSQLAQLPAPVLEFLDLPQEGKEQEAPPAGEEGTPATEEGEPTAAGTPAVGTSLAARAHAIMEQRCFSCHGAEKQKGKLRLDSAEAALAGGSSGDPSVKPNDPLSSMLVDRITLDPEHEDAMPPEGKEPITDEEIVTLIRWIHDGAAYPH